MNQNRQTSGMGYRLVTLAQISKELETTSYREIIKSVYFREVPKGVGVYGTGQDRTIKFGLHDNGLVALCSFKTEGTDSNVLLKTASSDSMRVDVYACLLDPSVDGFGCQRPKNKEIRLKVEKVRVGEFELDSRK